MNVRAVPTRSFLALLLIASVARAQEPSSAPDPGMREVHLWLSDEGLEAAFADIADIASRCRFSDCRHGSEPGCAVQAALRDGALAPERWERYKTLEAELDELAERLAPSGARGRRRREG